MESTLQRYGLFGAICLAYAAVLLWLLLRRRVTLQSSLLYLLLVLGLGAASLAMTFAPRWIGALGFELPSNFFFTLAIGGLAVLYLNALIALSRLELRSITLVQEVALMQEQLDRGEVLLRELRREREAAAGGGPAEASGA